MYYKKRDGHEKERGIESCERKRKGKKREIEKINEIETGKERIIGRVKHVFKKKTDGESESE